MLDGPFPFSWDPGCDPECWTRLFYGFDILSGFAFLSTAAVTSRNKNRPAILGLTAFLMTWGVQVILQNSADLVQDPIKTALKQVALVFVLLEPITLFYAIARLPYGENPRPPWSRRAHIGFYASTAVALLVLLLAIFVPAAVFDKTPLGPASAISVYLPQFTGLALALYFLSAFAATPSSLARAERELLFIGLWIPLAYQILEGLARSNNPLRLATFALVSLLLLGVLLRHVRNFGELSTRARILAGLALLLPIGGTIVFAPLHWANVAAKTPLWFDAVFSPGSFRLVALAPLIAYAIRVRNAPIAQPSGTAPPSRSMVSPLAVLLSMGVALVLMSATDFGDRTIREIYASALSLLGCAACILWFFFTDFAGVTPLRDAASALTTTRELLHPELTNQR